MKFQQLRYYVAVYEEGSFSAGAARSNATQSGLSMQIRDLEERFGTRLFDRVPSGIVPTEAGRRFYQHAIQVLQAAHSAEQCLSDARDQPMGHFKVGLMPTFTRSVLPSALLELNAKYPLIKVSVLEAYSEQLSQMTLAGELSFSIVPATPPRDGLRISPLGTDREFLVSGKNSAIEHGKPVRLRDLGELNLILPGTRNARRPGIERYLAAHGAQTADILEMDAMIGTIELVARSGWMSILPGLLCHADEAGMKRKLHPIVDPPLTVSYVRIEPSTRNLNQAEAIFSDLLSKHMNELLEWSNSSEFT
ncbi:MAG: LysR family transcriptional regulator [Hoeflea sp.]|uniref:LysR family transcriptional regulator n=1 Tax=Hoeflea sp. TaxID=1940281 RepID=UPI0032EE34FD